eukprot:g15534.t1
MVLECGQGQGDFEACEVHIDTIGLQGSELKYEVLFPQPSGGIVVALEAAQDGHVVQGVGGGVEVVREWEVQLFVANRGPDQSLSTDTLVRLAELVLTLNNFSFN